MKKLIFLLLFILGLMAMAQEDSGWIPMKLVKNTILVPVTISEDTLQMVVDTGGLFTLSIQAQKKLKFDQVDMITITDVLGIETDFERVTVGLLKVGNLAFSDRKALVIQDETNYPENCFGTNGMIGRDFFKDFILQFDYAKSRFRMTKDISELNLTSEYRTKMKISERGLPEFLVRINGKKMFIEFDSGSGDLFSFSTPMAEAYQLRSDEDRLEFEGVFSFGVSGVEPPISQRYQVLLNDLTIGGLAFERVMTNSSKPRSPRVGASMLYHGLVTLDYKNGDLYYEPYKDQPSINPFSTFGFSVAQIDGSYVVKWIIKGSKAEDLGIRPGQKILSLNGENPNNWDEPCDTYLKGFDFDEKSSVKLEVLKPDGSKMNVTLEKKIF